MIIRGDKSETHMDRTCRASFSGDQTNKEREEHQRSGWYANWQQIKEDLLDIKEGLKKEEKNNDRVIERDKLVEKLNKIIVCVSRGL